MQIDVREMMEGAQGRLAEAGHRAVVVHVVGRSGTGKTTLLHDLAGQVRGSLLVPLPAERSDEPILDTVADVAGQLRRMSGFRLVALDEPEWTVAADGDLSELWFAMLDGDGALVVATQREGDLDRLLPAGLGAPVLRIDLDRGEVRPLF